MHFVRDGHGVDQIDLNKLIGPCFVVDLPDVDSIDAQSLEQANIPANVMRLLCRTRNSEYWARDDNTFHTDFVAIDPSGAEWIVQHGVQLVGVDYLSVGAYEGGIPTHEILLSNGVVPVEGLDLSRIKPGEYQLICLPLKLTGLRWRAGAGGVSARRLSLCPLAHDRDIIALEKIHGAWRAMPHDEHRMSLREVADPSNDILF